MMTNKQNIIKAILESYYKNEPIENYDIGLIEKHFRTNKNGETVLDNYLIFLQDSRSGYLKSSRSYVANYANGRNVMNMVSRYLNEEEFFEYTFYRRMCDTKKNHQSILFIPKDQGKPIQNKLKIFYEINSHNTDGEALHLESFFVFKFKTFSDYPYYVYTSNDVSFWKQFPNKEAHLASANHSKVIEEKLETLTKTLGKYDKDIAELRRVRDNLSLAIKDIERIQANAQKGVESFYSLIPEDEISAMLLYKEIKKII